MMSTRFLVWALVIVALVFMANLGGIWWLLSL